MSTAGTPAGPTLDTLADTIDKQLHTYTDLYDHSHQSLQKACLAQRIIVLCGVHPYPNQKLEQLHRRMLQFSETYLVRHGVS